MAGSTDATLVIDGTQTGRTFEGVGMISGGGGNSRLLIDYPEPYRSNILDYLFKPDYGASLQILKVEIGSDCDSTDGAEASHMHTRTEENYHRGYEWWLMEQAKTRRPDLLLAALPWGVPGWADGGKAYFSQDLIDYMVKWLQHAQSDHHLAIDVVGGRNEKGYDSAWYKQFKAALRENGLARVRVIASDDWEPGKLWAIASDMKQDPALNQAIDIVGGHTPHEGGYPTADTLSLRQPIWSSEDHFDQDPPAKEMARSLNRNYINGKVTATIYWPIISALYDNLPYNNVGLIKCNQPWSGNYRLTPSLWVMAQTSQFAQPGWHYLDGGCGYVDGDATGKSGSYVTLASPGRRAYSLVFETVDATAPRTIAFNLTALPRKPLHVWSTNLNSAHPSDWFVREADVRPQDGHFYFTLQPGRVYSFTTTEGQHKGDAVPSAAAAFPLPYADDFKGQPGHLPRYFADLFGSFEIAPASGGRTGTCLRQTTPQAPIGWKGTGKRPFTMIGSLDWTDYTVSCDALLEKPGAVDLLARLSGMSGSDVPNSYLLRVADSGAWFIVKSSSGAPEQILASGTVAPLGIDTWHRLSLACRGPKITASIDGHEVGSVSNAGYPKGMAGLGTDDYLLAQFGHFRIDPAPMD